MKREEIDFLYEYYKEFNLSYWQNRLNYDFDKIEKLKREKNKYPYYTDLYALYLQLMEIFAINIFALMGENVIGDLFIESNSLREQINDKLLENDVYIEKFLNYLVFGIGNKEDINNYSTKFVDYKKVIVESFRDYIDDYRMLNSFKHGFRIRMGGSGSISMSHDNKNYFNLVNYNASITYYSVEKEDNKKILYSNSIHFNYERVTNKIHYLISMLQNTQTLFLAQIESSKGKFNGKIKIDTINVVNRELFNKSFGVGRFRNPLFVLGNAKPEIKMKN